MSAMSGFRSKPPTRLPNPHATPPTSQDQGQDPTLLLLGAAAVVVVVAVGAFFLFRGSSGERMTTVGGVPLNAPWYAFYQANQSVIGLPVEPETRVEQKRCVPFQYFVVCRRGDQLTGALALDYELLQLGNAALPPGIKATPTEMPPILQRRIELWERDHFDWRFWVQAPVTPAFCVSSPGAEQEATCAVFTPTQRLEWRRSQENDPTAPISLTPLGQYWHNAR